MGKAAMPLMIEALTMSDERVRRLAQQREARAREKAE